MAGTKRASDTPPDIAAETPVASDSIPSPPEPAAPDKGEEETPVIAGTELVVSVGQSIISSTLGLSLSEALDSTQWFEIGAYLGRAERKLQWVIGDWWCHGEHHYGVLLETTQEPCWRGPAYQTCANAGDVPFDVEIGGQALPTLSL